MYSMAISHMCCLFGACRDRSWCARACSISGAHPFREESRVAASRPDERQSRLRRSAHRTRSLQAPRGPQGAHEHSQAQLYCTTHSSPCPVRLSPSLAPPPAPPPPAPPPPPKPSPRSRSGSPRSMPRSASSSSSGFCARARSCCERERRIESPCAGSGTPGSTPPCVARRDGASRSARKDLRATSSCARAAAARGQRFRCGQAGAASPGAGGGGGARGGGGGRAACSRGVGAGPTSLAGISV